MGINNNITNDKFPEQGRLLGKPVQVCFHYGPQEFEGTCIRDDITAPFETIFQLKNGRVVLGTECQYRHIAGKAEGRSSLSVSASVRIVKALLKQQER